MGELRFPRLYAAASLKPGKSPARDGPAGMLSAALCRGLIEATPPKGHSQWQIASFPRLYAAASLRIPVKVITHSGGKVITESGPK